MGACSKGEVIQWGGVGVKNIFWGGHSMGG